MRANAQRANVVVFSVSCLSFETRILDWQSYAHHGAHGRLSNTYGYGMYIAEAIGDERIPLPFKDSPAKIRIRDLFPKPITFYLFSSPPIIFCA